MHIVGSLESILSIVLDFRGIIMQVSLKVLAGNHEGKIIPIKDEKFFIGRSESCQLRPKSESVSRRHCAIVQKEGRVLLVDLKSRNGTYVNEKQLSPEKAKILKSGDKLRIGQLEFEIAIEVGIANAKRSEVTSVKQAADRMSEQKSSIDSRESFDISSWLIEADQIDRKKPVFEPETRQFTMEDTTRLDSGAIDEASGDVIVPDSAVDEPQKSKRPDKKGPIKLPKSTAGPTTKNTKDAASETLKKYFGGR
jgi:pSer/pThr/pTyr-binding forkhead associated (FHA) protein